MQNILISINFPRRLGHGSVQCCFTITSTEAVTDREPRTAAMTFSFTQLLSSDWVKVQDCVFHKFSLLHTLVKHSLHSLHSSAYTELIQCNKWWQNLSTLFECGPEDDQKTRRCKKMRCGCWMSDFKFNQQQKRPTITMPLCQYVSLVQYFVE